MMFIKHMMGIFLLFFTLISTINAPPKHRTILGTFNLNRAENIKYKKRSSNVKYFDVKLP